MLILRLIAISHVFCKNTQIKQSRQNFADWRGGGRCPRGRPSHTPVADGGWNATCQKFSEGSKIFNLLRDFEIC